MSEFILRPLGSFLDQSCSTFGPRLGDGVPASNEKYRAILPHDVGFDLLAHKRTGRVFSPHLRATDRYQRRVSLLLLANVGNQLARFRSISIRLQIGRKNDMLGQNHRTIAKQRHGAHGVAQFAKVSAPLMVKQLLHRFGMNCRDVFALF